MELVVVEELLLIAEIAKQIAQPISAVLTSNFTIRFSSHAGFFLGWVYTI